jgi:hypothetical protein
MSDFLRENWLWIVVPLVVVVAGAIAFLVLTGGSEEVNPFIYNPY